MTSGSPLARLQEWYRSPLGAEVAAIEDSCAQRLLNDTFGYFLVQIGATESFRAAMASTRIRHRILMPCVTETSAGTVQIVGAPSQLPFAADAIDAVFLPHTLDFWPKPRAVLREVERVLIPEGRVIVMGFNALSLWGLVSLVQRRTGAMPWCGHFRTAHTVEDWLSVLGFDIECRESLIFRPPITAALGPGLASFDEIGRRVGPALGGIYVIRAVKRVATLTPLRPSWRRRALLPGRAVEPTTRGVGDA